MDLSNRSSERSSMPDEDSIITLLGSVAMEKKAYRGKSQN